MRRRRQELVRTDDFQFERAAAWPISSCLISENWTDQEVLVQIILTRAAPKASSERCLAVGVYLVDPACLGLKNTFGKIVTAIERRELIDTIGRTTTLREADAGIAAGIIRAGIDYAAKLGFEPQSDFRTTHCLVASIPPVDVSGRLKLGGPEGKPRYISGPEDDVDAILQRLTARLGPDGFDYVLAG
jgi:hypothetical protein